MYSDKMHALTYLGKKLCKEIGYIILIVLFYFFTIIPWIPFTYMIKEIIQGKSLLITQTLKYRGRGEVREIRSVKRTWCITAGFEDRAMLEERQLTLGSRGQHHSHPSALKWLQVRKGNFSPTDAKKCTLSTT